MHTEEHAGRFNPDEMIFAYLKGNLDEEGKKSFLEWLDLGHVPFVAGEVAG